MPYVHGSTGRGSDYRLWAHLLLQLLKGIHPNPQGMPYLWEEAGHQQFPQALFSSYGMNYCLCLLICGESFCLCLLLLKSHICKVSKRALCLMCFHTCAHWERVRLGSLMAFLLEKKLKRIIIHLYVLLKCTVVVITVSTLNVWEENR